MKEVLDSRFFSTVFFERETALRDASRSRLRQLRKEKRGILPAIVIAEVANLICREGGRDLARAHVRALVASGLTIAPLDAEIGAAAGLLRCIHRGLPLADAVIATIALQEDGCVVSDDPHFEGIKGLRVTWLD